MAEKDGSASDSYVHALRRPGETLADAKRRLGDGEAVRIEGRQRLFDRVRELTRRGGRDEAARTLGHSRWKRRDLA